MKKLLVLGGDHFAIPVVKAAQSQGYYVITCDYLPDNVAHKYSDEFANFDTKDKEGILNYAREKKIDGICTFTDSGVVTTAYVQHHLGLPQIGPLESVEILQNKARFRKFLSDNCFNVPRAKGYDNIDDVIKDIDYFEWPVIVKPVDSAGSKGVTKLDTPEHLANAVEYALSFSPSKNIIIEEFIKKAGCSSDTDCFSVNGLLKVATFSAQRFDETAAGPYVPAAFSWPSTFSQEEEIALKDDLQRLLSLLNMNTTIYNVETRVGINGKPYIMEVSPRGGGNRLAECVRYATGVDMITAHVRAAVGDSIGEMELKPYNGHWCEIILHADKPGIFSHLEISKELPADIIDKDLWVEAGNLVEAFRGANKAIGTLILKFNTSEEMEYAITHQSEWLKVVVD